MPAMHLVQRRGQHWANSWGSPIGHAVEQLGRFDLPMEVLGQQAIHTHTPDNCSAVLAIRTVAFSSSELSSGLAASAARTAGANGREVRTAPLGPATLCVKGPTSMARSKALFAVAAVLLCALGQDASSYTSPRLYMSKDHMMSVSMPCCALLQHGRLSFHSKAAGLSYAQEPCVTSYQSAARNDELTYVAQAMEVCNKLSKLFNV